MLELTLAEALLTSLRPGCRLVLVGDPDQLPPVGAGELLRDAVASGLLPSVDMRQIFRQVGGARVLMGAGPGWQQACWHAVVGATCMYAAPGVYHIPSGCWQQDRAAM